MTRKAHQAKELELYPVAWSRFERHKASSSRELAILVCGHDIGLFRDAFRLIVGLVRSPFLLARLRRFLLGDCRRGRSRDPDHRHAYYRAELHFHVPPRSSAPALASEPLTCIKH